MDGYTRLLLVQLVGIIIVAVCFVHGIETIYNPLGSQYKKYMPTGFSFHLTDGPLSASTADYTPSTRDSKTSNPPCIRAVVFMAHGAVLDHLQTDCDTLESAAGLVTLDSALRYYNIVAFRQEAPGRFVSFTRTGEKDTCTKKVFLLEEDSGPKELPSPKVITTEITPGKNCDNLDVALPPMLLLSSSEGDGKFSPVSEEWMLYNAGEKLGLMSREYRYKDKCYRLVVITSEGVAVRSVKLSCGPIHDVTSTDGSLRLGNTLYATEYLDTVMVLLNTGYNYCIKKMNTIESEYRIVKTVMNKDNVLTLKDRSCRRLIKGEVEGSTVDRQIVNQLKTSPIKNKFKQEILKPFTPSGELYDYNIARDMGMMVQTYTNDVDHKQSNIVTLVSRGVLVLPVIVEAGPPKRIVIQDNAVYYGKDVAFTKLHARDGYQVLKRLDDAHCWRKLFTVKEKNGPLEDTYEDNIDVNGPETKQKGTREESPTTKPEGNILDDKQCKDLIGGLHLKDIKALLSDVKKN